MWLDKCDDDIGVKNQVAKGEVYSRLRCFCMYHLSWFWEGAETKWSSS